MTDAQNIQDHPLDESTGIRPQHFDADGYVVGHEHHTAVSSDDLGSDGLLSQPEETTAPPPGGDPDQPVPGTPEGVPIDPDLTPDEPAPFAPDEAAEAAEPQRTVGGVAFH